MEKDKHELPDLDDTFAAKVKKGPRRKNDSGVIFGPDSRVISKVDPPESRALPRKPQDRQ